MYADIKMNILLGGTQLEHYISEQHIFRFLVQLAVILLLARRLGELFHRIKPAHETEQLFKALSTALSFYAIKRTKR